MAATLTAITGMSILDVEDTRQREEDGKVVPYSGEQRPCDCCGRAIDVLVTVVNAKTSRWNTEHGAETRIHTSGGLIVGMTCARKAGCTDLRKLRVKIVRG